MKFKLLNPIVAVILIQGVVGCGGGGAGGGTTGATTPTNSNAGPSRFTLSGIIYDASQKPVAGADIVFDAGGTVLQTTTSSDGSYSLKAPDTTYPEFIAGVVRKEGFVNSTLQVSTSAGNFRVVGGDVLIVKTEANLTLLNDLNASRIVHLGDNNFSGSANSQLQLNSSSGLSRTYLLATGALTARVVAQYNQACLTFSGRGIQSTSSKDTLQFGAKTQLLIDSPNDGSFQTFKYCFDAVAVAMPSFTIFSGNNQGKSSDYDDFEVINPVAALEGKISGSLPLPAIGSIYGDAQTTGFTRFAAGTAYYKNSAVAFGLIPAVIAGKAFYPTGTKSLLYNFGDGTAPDTVAITEKAYQSEITFNLFTVDMQPLNHTYLTTGNKTITVSYLDSTGKVISTVSANISVV